MFFIGVQKNSFIDYPGKVSCIFFLTGCNFTCPYCHNPELARGTLPPAGRVRIEAAFAFLEKRRGLLDGVVLSGGEPTLSDELGGIIRRIRQLGYAVKLDTNGSRPETLARLLATGDIDYVAMDVKAPLTHYTPGLTRQNVSEKLKKSIRTIMASGVDYEFRTTCVTPFAGPDKIPDIARCIAGARKYVLQKFNPSTVLTPDFFSPAHPQPDKPALEAVRDKVAPLVQECLIR